MTRQLFPSPSQGALICAGGEEEGRRSAAPASAGAGRRDPTPHFWRLDSRLRAFLGGFWALLGILLLRVELSLRRARGARLAVPGTALVPGQGSSAVHLRQRNSLQPRPACVRIAAAGRRLSDEREGDGISISSHRVTGGSAFCRVGLFVVVFNSGTSNPFSD